MLGLPVALDLSRPFTATEARDYGLTAVQLRGLTQLGVLVHPMRGVYYSSHLEDCLALRVDCLRLVVPRDGVVTDRTAAWLWGALMALAPNDHLTTPRVSVFCPPGRRLRNGLSRSGERMLSAEDVVELDGLLVTTPLRTACDLGRLLHRDQAFAAMDALAALNLFTIEQLVAECRRFKGYRGVVQLRVLAPFVDPFSQSPGESILRLRWLDVGLPRPECQIEVPGPWGSSYWLDLGLRRWRFAAEYDGEQFHTEADRPRDDGRRTWLSGSGRWTIVVARRDNIHGPHQDIHERLLEGARTARLRLDPSQTAPESADPSESF